MYKHMKSMVDVKPIYTHPTLRLRLRLHVSVYNSGVLLLELIS